MILVKQVLSKKYRKIVRGILEDLIDLYGDFYITKDNVRLPIIENKEILYKCLKKGDKIAIDKTEREGIGLIYGYSDHHPRKYVKILADNEIKADMILKVLMWNSHKDLYAKVNKKNSLIDVLKHNNFEFFKYRGSELIYKLSRN